MNDEIILSVKLILFFAQLVSIAERTIMEADEDKDNLISFDEFSKVLQRTDVEQKMSIRFLS